MITVFQPYTSPTPPYPYPYPYHNHTHTHTSAFPLQYLPHDTTRHLHLLQTPDYDRRAAWCRRQIAPSSKPPTSGPPTAGCREHEATAYLDYLQGMNPIGASARRIMLEVLGEEDPEQAVRRVWRLLAMGMVDLGGEARERTMELVGAVRGMEAWRRKGRYALGLRGGSRKGRRLRVQRTEAREMSWMDLPGLSKVWCELYRRHVFEREGWEDVGCIAARQKAALRDVCESIGRAEAEMYVRGIVVPQRWGNEVVNLVSDEFRCLDVLLWEVRAWLSVAGSRLKAMMQRDEVVLFRRPAVGDEREERTEVAATMERHWECWREDLLALTWEESDLSAEGRQVARECYEMM